MSPYSHDASGQSGVEETCVQIHLVNHELRGRIERVVASEKGREAVLKDFHLIEAALATDRMVISLDENAKGLFAAASRILGALRNVAWVNPDKPEERPIPWLENGARLEKKRLLGSRSGFNRATF